MARVLAMLSPGLLSASWICVKMPAWLNILRRRRMPPKMPHCPHGTRVIHRVCIQCNNMFRVTPDRFDAKQCPNCHKG